MFDQTTFSALLESPDEATLLPALDALDASGLEQAIPMVTNALNLLASQAVGIPIDNDRFTYLYVYERPTFTAKLHSLHSVDQKAIMAQISRNTAKISPMAAAHHDTVTCFTRIIAQKTIKNQSHAVHIAIPDPRTHPLILALIKHAPPDLVARLVRIDFSPEFAAHLAQSIPDRIAQFTDLAVYPWSWLTVRTWVKAGVFPSLSSSSLHYSRFPAHAPAAAKTHISRNKTKASKLTRFLLDHPDTLEHDLVVALRVDKSFNTLDYYNVDSRNSIGLNVANRWDNTLVELHTLKKLTREQVISLLSPQAPSPIESYPGAIAFKMPTPSPKELQRIQMQAQERAQERNAMLDRLHSLEATWRNLLFLRIQSALSAEDMAYLASQFNSPETDSIALALQAIEDLLNRAIIAPAAIYEITSPIFSHKPKKNPLTLLAIIKTHAAPSPNPDPTLIQLLLTAMSHPALEVQEMALSLLDTLTPSKSPDLLQQLHDARPQIAPSMLSAFDALLKTHIPPVAVSVTDAEPGELPALIEQARALPPRIQSALAIPALLAAADAPGNHDLLFSRPDLPSDLWPATPVAPILTHTQLIDRISAGLESTSEDYVELELILDALARLLPTRNADFDNHIAPILHRLKQPPQSMFISLVKHHAWAIEALLQGPEVITPISYSESSTTARPRDILSRLLVHQVKAARALPKALAPLLSCPTHQEGWVDPLILVGRLTDRLTNHLDVYPLDYSLALARLSPHNRAQALEQARRLTTPHALPLRYALGDDIAIPDDAALMPWGAASRARDPHASDPAAQRWADTGPDVASPCQFSWSVTHAQETVWDRQSRTQSARDYPVFTLVRTAPRTYPTSDSFYPAWAFHYIVQPRTDFSHSALEDHEILGYSTLWPAMPERYEAFAAALAARLLDADSVSDVHPQEAVFNPLVRSGRPLGEFAHIALAMGLQSKPTAGRMTAVSAFLLAIDEGRCDPILLGTLAGRLAAQEITRPARFADTLAEAARVSPLHALAVTRLIAAYLTHLFPLAASPKPPLGLPRLLETYLAVLAQFPAPIPLAAQATLQRMADLKSGKSSTLSKSLLKLSTPAPSTVLNAQALTQALQGRLTLTKSFQ